MVKRAAGHFRLSSLCIARSWMHDRAITYLDKSKIFVKPKTKSRRRVYAKETQRLCMGLSSFLRCILQLFIMDETVVLWTQ